jgi:hypothetical protein
MGWTHFFLGASRKRKERKKRMNLSDRSRTHVLLGGTPPSAFKVRGSVRVGSHVEAGDAVSSTTRKKVRAKSIRTCFWICAVFIVVAVELALWPVRKLYLTFKEKFDER